ncbi:MAG: SAM-dependent methyltransferase [Chitinophagaceae bacterium]|nr:SAM-dependent methyltransferase [Chitinophagaceae bacterium]
MYSSFQYQLRYLRYYCTAANGKGHGVHSPFVFDFIENVLNDERVFYAFPAIEKIRQRILSGLATTVHNTSILQPVREDQLLFRMINYYGPVHILETSTSLGITTAYLATANPSAHITTLQKDTMLAVTATAHFRELHIGNISQLTGDIQTGLESWLSSNNQVDIVLLNGFLYEAAGTVVDCFNRLLEKAHDETIFIIPQIHRSAAMEQDWAAITGNNRVSLSIDLFFAGLVFFRKEHKVKQHVSIRF